MSPIRTALKAAFDQLLGNDPNCIVCGQDVFEPEFGMCQNCFNQFPFTDDPLVGRAFAVAKYESPVKELIYEYKYNDQRYLADYMAQLMAAFFLESGMEADLLVTVPASHQRKLVRGFDHMAHLADKLAHNLGIDYEKEVLIRVKETQRMKELSKAERLEELEAAFEVQKPEWITGKRILLIDDILTTGATLTACSDALNLYQPKQIEWLTFAAVL